jgi:FKBP-type peptidyl-prolyl cis-trans isomerase FkpA
MRTIKSILIGLSTAAILAACGSTDYQKTRSGLMYKIKSTSKDSTVKPGNVMKIHFVQKLNDSVMNTSYGKMPAFVPIDEALMNPEASYDPREIFRLLRKGDSVEVVQLVDSLMKRYPGALPPNFKKGDRLVTGFKVMDVYANAELARKDMEAAQQAEMERTNKENEAASAKAVQEVAQLIQSKKINAVKVGAGTYVAVTNPGSGAIADSGKYVTVHYTGKSLADGKVFESSRDAGREPYSFVLGQRNVIPGWDEGLRGLKKGAKATLYIPGTMAYGPQPGPGGRVFESLIFDVEMVDVQDKAPVAKQPTMPVMPDTTQVQR